MCFLVVVFSAGFIVTHAHMSGSPGSARKNRTSSARVPDASEVGSAVILHAPLRRAILSAEGLGLLVWVLIEVVLAFTTKVERETGVL